MPPAQAGGHFVKEEFTRGCWSPQESQLHINALELIVPSFGFAKAQKRDKHSTVVGQPDSSVSYQQNERHQVTHYSGPYKNGVAMVPQAQNIIDSTTHSGKGQFQGRLLVCHLRD